MADVVKADTAHIEDEKSQSHIINAQNPAPAVTRPSNRKSTKRKGPSYADIHRKPFPLEVHPLPTFHPTNPVSLLCLLYEVARQWVHPPTSHPAKPYTGYLSAETRSVHVTDPADVRALWEMGFFGKGTLSRSEPSWLDREKARLAARKQGGQTAEETTKARREERRMFKLERARAERERIDRQKTIEQGGTVVESAPTDHNITDTTNGNESILPKPANTIINTIAIPSDANGIVDTVTGKVETAEPAGIVDETEDVPQIDNEEHLQLTFEEAFFLKYALGVLDVRLDPLHDSRKRLAKTNAALLSHFRDLARGYSRSHGPDEEFLLNYVVYHHFRSLGWVVRPGMKFSVDYLLYNRGPVFSHAEFGVLIIPSYSDAYWASAEGKKNRRVKEQKDWWWLHCINRVQSQVKKSLVLCYVDVPPPHTQENVEVKGVSNLLRGYKVREFVIRRWLMNRSRD